MLFGGCGFAPPLASNKSLTFKTMTNEDTLKNITVSVAWCGAEPTLIRKEKGGEKFEIKPGESMEVEVELAKGYRGAFLINATPEEIEAFTKSNVEKRKADEKREKENAKARIEAEAQKAEAKKADEEELEAIDEDGDGEISIEEMGKKECKAYLDERGVDYPANAKVDELRELVRIEASNELHDDEDQGDQDDAPENTEEEGEVDEDQVEEGADEEGDVEEDVVEEGEEGAGVSEEEKTE